ncbi:hypothetical protein [Gaopeijia maritima]|uniref:Uncharacterized protein n=1 Tax=Gaopeijia maritima TaxID=3119007 RepID=A0ABU9E666_9BACT
MRPSHLLLKTASYLRAPKTTLVLSHPIRGTAAVVALKAVQKAAPPRLGSALVWMAATTAVPLWLMVRGARRAADEAQRTGGRREAGR